jgi:cytoskeletal protein RodZ
MRLFRKKQETTDTTTPTELQDYYQAENRERRGMAWLLAFVTFFVTLALVLLVFFTGKWAYQRFKDKSKSPHTTSQTKPQGESNNNSNNTDQSKSSSNSNTNGNNNSAQTNNGSSTQGAQNTTPQTSSTSTSVPSQQPVTGGNELPRTGPDEDL